MVKKDKLNLLNLFFLDKNNKYHIRDLILIIKKQIQYYFFFKFLDNLIFFSINKKQTEKCQKIKKNKIIIINLTILKYFFYQVLCEDNEDQHDRLFRFVINKERIMSIVNCYKQNNDISN